MLRADSSEMLCANITDVIGTQVDARERLIYRQSSSEMLYAFAGGAQRIAATLIVNR